MTVEEMHAQPCVPISDELAKKAHDTIAAPAILNPHKVAFLQGSMQSGSNT
jgi:hypothetical protein